jgi:uncharacterized membrane protein YeaQ/YmgE (transglycosylase-associated protein family)
LGGWVFSLFGHPGVYALNLYSIFVAFVGAVLLLAILRAFSGRRSAV